MVYIKYCFNTGVSVMKINAQINFLRLKKIFNRVLIPKLLSTIFQHQYLLVLNLWLYLQIQFKV